MPGEGDPGVFPIWGYGEDEQPILGLCLICGEDVDAHFSAEEQVAMGLQRAE
jgi:hypothetical protein